MDLRSCTPPKDVTADFTDTSVFMVFERRYPGAQAMGAAVTCFLLASMAIAAAILSEGGGFFILSGIMLALGGISCLVLPFFITEQLAVSPSALEVHVLYPWGISRRRQIETSTIKDVTVEFEDLPAISRSPGPLAIHIFTENEVVVFGRKLKKESKNWVRDCIIAAISKGGGQTG